MTHSGPRMREDIRQQTDRCRVTLTKFNAPKSSYTESIGKVGTNRSMRDIVTSNFRRQVADGVVINNPASSIKDSITRTYATLERHVYGQVTPKQGDLLAVAWAAAPLVPPQCNQASYSLDIERLQALAAARALAGVAPPDATSLLTLGELGETLALLKNPIDGLITAFRKLVYLRRKFWKAQAAGLITEGIASQYLAVMFGMLPLINDAKMFEGLLSRFVPPRRTSRAEFRDESSYQTNYAFSNPYNQPFTGSVFVKGAAKVVVRAGSLYEYAYQEDTSSIFGLRISDVPIAAWQLTGFSFLADWALNIGTMIRAFTPIAGVNRLAEWVTTNVTITETATLSPLYHSDNSVWTGSGGGDTCTRIIETYSRVPCNLGAVAGLRFNIPWSVTKTLLSLSLLTQAIAGAVKGKPIPLRSYARP